MLCVAHHGDNSMNQIEHKVGQEDLKGRCQSFPRAPFQEFPDWNATVSTSCWSSQCNCLPAQKGIPIEK